MKPYSMTMEGVLALARKLADVQDAPAITVEHFLLALALDLFPPYAEGVLQIYEEVRDQWQEEVR